MGNRLVRYIVLCRCAFVSAASLDQISLAHAAEVVIELLTFVSAAPFHSWRQSSAAQLRLQAPAPVV